MTITPGRKGKNKSIILFLVGLIMTINVLPVYAEESAKGNIRIQLTDGEVGTSKEGVTFEYAKVAELSDGKYYLLDDYSGSGVNLNEIEYANDLDKAANILNEYVTADGETVTDKDGYAILSNLEIGVYLLRVSDKAGYENVAPALISIPVWSVVSKEMDYEVTVMPKHSPNVSETIANEVKTGDDNLPIIFSLLILCSVLSFLFVLHNNTLRKKTGSN